MILLTLTKSVGTLKDGDFIMQCFYVLAFLFLLLLYDFETLEACKFIYYLFINLYFMLVCT